MTEPTQKPPQVTATVSPAPPPKSRWDAIPHHLGRARTSTVVLSVLFLAIGALWLNVRPDPDAPSPPPVVQQPVAPAPTTATPPEPTDDPAPTTSAEPRPTSEAPTTAPEGTTPTGASTLFPTPTSETPAPAPEPTTSPTG